MPTREQMISRCVEDAVVSAKECPGWVMVFSITVLMDLSI